MFSVTVFSSGLNGKDRIPSVKGIWILTPVEKYSFMAVRRSVYYTVDFDSEEEYLAKKDEFIAVFETGLKELGIYNENENGRKYTISTPITRAEEKVSPEGHKSFLKYWHESRKNEKLSSEPDKWWKEYLVD